MDIAKGIDNGFPTIKDVPIESADQSRMLNRQQYTQQTVIQGTNKAILLNDGVNDRILIGYQKGGF